MTEAIVPYKTMALSDVMTVGEILAKSGFFQDSRDMAQAVTKILAGNELGIGPVAAMTSINIIKGRVTLSANAIAAAIKRSGKYDYRIKRLDNNGCEIEFFESGKAVGTSAFADEDAKAANLVGENWTKYRRNMFFARAMSNGAKWYCPDVFNGPVYTADELGADVTMDDNGDVVDVKPEPAKAKPATGAGFTAAGSAAQQIVEKIVPKQAVDRPKVARVVTGYWAATAKALVDAEPYYAKDGQPDWFHLTAAAFKLGYPEITDANLQDVKAALQQYANDQKALAATESLFPEVAA